MSGGEIGPEVVERMVAFVRLCDTPEYRKCSAIEDEARAIAALLPELADPDLVEARRNAAIECVERENDIGADLCLKGEWDAEPLVVASVRAIKRGRELERAGK